MSLSKKYRNYAKRALNRLKRKRSETRVQPTKTIIVASAHKVGSTWLYRLLSNVGIWPADSNEGIPSDLLETGTVLLDPQFFAWLGDCNSARLLKSHSFPPKEEEMPSPLFKIATIHRDPRDVLVSASFYLANLDPELGGVG